jgi:hypothetical protein
LAALEDEARRQIAASQQRLESLPDALADERGDQKE